MTPTKTGLPVRRLSAEIVRDILVGRNPLDEVLGTCAQSSDFRALEQRDRSFIRAIVMTTIRRLGQIDAVLASFLAKPLPAKSGTARHILLTGAAQLLFLETSPYAAIDNAVRLAALDRSTAGFKGLINAVLRKVADQGPALIAAQDAARLNTPDWLWNRWMATYGETVTRQIAEHHLKEPALDLTARSDPEALAAALQGQRLPTGTVRLASAGRIESLAGYERGEWWVQDAAACLPALLLGDIAGRNVLDLCAAPGGKTAQLAARGARVTAVDRSAARLERLNENMKRLGLDTDVVKADASTFTPDVRPDAILLDAPCSATGTIRRHPDVGWNKTEAMIETLTVTQARLLRHAGSLLDPGARLIYCTCSLEPEEGIAQIEALLVEDTGLSRVPVEPAEVPGFEAAVTAAGDLRTLPFHCNGPAIANPGADGFFVARLQRVNIV